MDGGDGSGSILGTVFPIVGCSQPAPIPGSTYPGQNSAVEELVSAWVQARVGITSAKKVSLSQGPKKLPLLCLEEKLRK